MNLPRFTNSRFWHAGAALFYIGLFLWIASSIWDTLKPKPTTPRVEGNFLCKNTIHAELESPDKNRMASLFTTDCGASTTSSTGINVLNRQDGKIHRGVFRIAGQPRDLDMRWTDNRILTVSGFSIEDLRALSLDNVPGVKVMIKP